MANNTLISIADGNITDAGVHGFTLEYGDVTSGTTVLNLSSTDLYGLPFIATVAANIKGLTLNSLSVNVPPNSTDQITITVSVNNNLNSFSFPLTAFTDKSSWNLIKFPSVVPIAIGDTVFFSLKTTNNNTASIIGDVFGAKDVTLKNDKFVLTNCTQSVDTPYTTFSLPSIKCINGSIAYTSGLNGWTISNDGYDRNLFTCEGWFKFSSNTVEQNIFWIGGTAGYRLYLSNTGQIRMASYQFNPGASNWVDQPSGHTISNAELNTWVYIAFGCRVAFDSQTSTSGYRVIKNGVILIPNILWTYRAVAPGDLSFRIMSSNANTICAGVKLTYNEWLYPADFNNTAFITNPSPFTAGANTLVLLNFGYNFNKSVLTDALSDDLLNATTLTSNFSSNMPLLSAEDPFNDVDKNSLYTDGAARVLGINDPTGKDFTLSANDFTLDFWAKPSVNSVINTFITNAYPSDFNGIWVGQTNISNGIEVVFGNGSSWIVDKSSTSVNTLISAISAPMTNNWSQFTVNRKHGFVSVYRNGQIINNFPATTVLTNANSGLYIGGRFTSSQMYNGLLYNVHLVNGTALYPVDVTPPTSALSANSDTLLMMHTQDVSGNRVDDTSQNGSMFYNNRGNLTARNPFNDPTKNSLRFDGVTNRLKILQDSSTTNDFVLSTGDFTLDFWVYPFDNAASTGMFVCNALAANTEGGIYVQNTTTANQIYYGFGNAALNTNTVTATNSLNPYLSSPVLTTWSQFTLTRKRNIVSFYRNGQIIGSVPDSSPSNPAAVPVNLTNPNKWMIVGGRTSSSQYSNSMISNVRLVKGTNLYEIDYTVAASPISATPETTLLLRSSATSAADVSNYANIIYNNRGTLTANNPFNDPNERSLYYDGLSNKLRVLTAGNAFNLSANNFTIELFVYPLSGKNCAYLTTADPTDYQGVFIGQASDTQFQWAVGPNGAAWSYNRTLSAPSLSGKWNHITLNRANSTFYATINGAVTDVWNISGAQLTLTNTNSSISIGGRNLNNHFSKSYISNVNFINGTAKYPLTSFATPSVALSTVSGTVCLVNGTGVLNGTNGAFIDSSSSSYSISAFGSVSQANFSPYVGTGGNGIFNGTSDNLVVQTPNSGLDFGSNSFTVELWVYPSVGYTTTSRYFIDTRTTAASGSWAFGTGLGTGLTRISWIKNNTISTNVDYGLSANAWNHLVYSRDVTLGGSGVGALFVNGVKVTSAFDSTNYTFGSLSATIGTRYNKVSGFFDGSLSDIRVVNGSVVYDITQDTLTVPSAPLTNIANTKLLMNFSNASIFDLSYNNGFNTFNGATTKNTTSKYNPGALYFDSTSNLVSYTTRNLNLSTSDFTIEGWFYSLSSSPTTTRTLFTVGNSHNDGVMLRMDGLYVASSATAVTNSEWISGANYTGVFPISTWKHVAVTRKNGYVSTWVDGKRTTTTYVPRDLGLSKKLTIGGASHVTNNNFFGYIDDFRIERGVCLYDTNFTVPSSQIAPHADTKFILNNSNYEAYTNMLSLCSPFGYGNSESFCMSGSTGITDALYTVTSANNLGVNNFSMEFWVYPLNMATTGYWLRTDSRDNNGIFIGYTSPTVLSWGFSNNGTVALNNTVTVSNVLSTWNHFVFTKNNNVYTLYRNGSAIDSGYSILSPNNGNNTIYIGSSPLQSTAPYGFTNGYISNVRVISGKNIFSSNFTPATAEFDNVPNTKLLLNESSYDRYTRVDSLCSPFGYGVSDSVLLSGEDGLYTTVNSSSLTGTNFTVEFWAYMLASTSAPFVATNNPTINYGFYIGATNNTTLAWKIGNGTSYFINKTVTVSSMLSTWNHISLVKNGYAYTLYLNGSAIDGDYSVTTPTFNNNRINIGYDTTPTYTNAYISNVRVLSGVALYNSNFSPATADFTPVANTKLLLNSDNQNSYLSMSSLSSPYAGGAGSTYFSGTQFMSAYHPTNFNFSTNDFTIEFWVYPTKLSIFGGPKPWFNTASPVNGGGIYIGYSSDSSFYLALGTFGGFQDSAINTITGTTLFNKWTHICLTRSGNVFTLYQNGSSVWTTTNAATIPNLNNAVTWGGRFSDKSYNSFYLSNARILNGTCLYSSNFTPTDITSQNLFCDVVLHYDLLYPTLTYRYTNSKLLDIRIMGNITQTGIEVRTLTANTVSLKNVIVDTNGVLTFPLTESKSLTINGNNGLLIQGGSLNIGTQNNPIPSNITHNLIFGNSNGLTATNNGMINVYGSYKLPYTTTTDNILCASNTFTVVDDVSTTWLSGDKVAIVHLSSGTTTYDLLTLSGFNDNKTFKTFTNTTVAHSALSSVNLSYIQNIPNFVNFTRNVKIKGGSNVVRGYVKILDTAKANINNAAFQNFGINSTDLKGVTIATNTSGYAILSSNVFYGDYANTTSHILNSTTSPIIYNLSAINNAFIGGYSSIDLNSITLSSVNITNNLILSSINDGISLINLSGSSVFNNNYIYKSGRHGLLSQQSNLSINNLYSIGNTSNGILIQQGNTNLYNLYSIGNTSNGLKLLSSYFSDSNNINLSYNNDSGIDGTLITGNYKGINSLYNKNRGISATFGTVSSAILSNINTSYNPNEGLYIDASNGSTINTYNVTANSNNKGIRIINSGSTLLNLNNTLLSSNSSYNLEANSIYGTISGLSSFENTVKVSLANNSTLIDGICSNVTANLFNILSTGSLVTKVGIVSSFISPFTPSVGYSLYFDGLGAASQNTAFLAPRIPNYFDLSIASNNAVTYEFWFYTLNLPDVNNNCRLINTGYNDTPNSFMWFGFGSDGSCGSGVPRTGYPGLGAPANTIKINTWHHIAVTLNGSNASLFVDGVLKGSANNFGRNTATNNTLSIGFFETWSTVNHPFRGYIYNFRLCSGVIYTSDFVPSTAPLFVTPSTLCLFQDPFGPSYLYSSNLINIETYNVYISGGINYNQTYIRNSNIKRITKDGVIGYPLVLDSVHLNQFFLENSQLSGTYGDVALLNNRNRVTGSYIFNNCMFSSTPLPFGLGAYQPDVSKATGLAFTNYNKIKGNHITYLPAGTRTIDTVLYDTNSSDQISERLIPSSSTKKLKSGSKFVAVNSGEYTTVGVLVSKSANYNGSNPRLILKRNAGNGINDDTVLATLSSTATPGTFYPIFGSSPVMFQYAALEFYVDCDGTNGYINVDSWYAY